MNPTVITCGQLRLTVPHGATLPSVNMTASGEIDLSFENFTGVLTFEAIHVPEKNLSTSPELPIASHPVESQPILSAQPISSISSQPVPALTSQPLPALSSQPVSSQPVQLQSPQSHLLPALTPPMSQELLPFSTYPSSQVPDSLTDSQLRPNETPSLPHFNNNQNNYLPLTPPSSQDSDQSPPSLTKSQSQQEKRPAPAKVEYRPSKQGKRVRFEDQPIILDSPCKLSTPVSAPKLPAAWETVALSDPDKIPRRRWGATFTRLQGSGSVILLGGESEAEGFVKQMSIFDADKRLWLQDGNDTPDMPGSGRAWHTTTCIDVSLFVFGGEKDVDGVRTQTNDALMYDTTYYTWYPPALAGQVPIPRAGHCAALVPGSKNLVIYGGINGNRWLNDLHMLEELNSWSKVRLSSKSVRPSARSYASLTPATGFLVLFGGNNKTRCFNDVHLLTADMTWVEPVILGRSPKPRTGHCAIPSQDGNKVIVYGGWDDQGAHRLFYSDIWELHIKSQSECQWRCMFAGDNASKTPGPRAGAALCSVAEEHDEMLLFGGWYQLSYFNDLHKLVSSGNKKVEGPM